MERFVSIVAAGHYGITEDFYFVHTITKLALDRRMQTRRGGRHLLQRTSKFVKANLKVFNQHYYIRHFFLFS